MKLIFYFSLLFISGVSFGQGRNPAGSNVNNATSIEGVLKLQTVTTGISDTTANKPLVWNSTTKSVNTAFWLGAGGGSGNPFADNVALVKNNSDNTKSAIFSAASISTATTRTYTLPNTNLTLAGIDVIQTFSLAQTFTKDITAGGQTFGSNNSISGLQIGGALNATTTSATNIGIGNQAGHNLLVGTLAFTGLGVSAGSTTTGSYVTAIGYAAGKATGQHNTSVGGVSGGGNGAGGTASETVSIGWQANGSVTNGTGNTSIGANANPAITTGDYNTTVGESSCSLQTTASYNVGMGRATLFRNVSGNENVAIGAGAGNSATAGNNTFIGMNSAFNDSTGSFNIVIGSWLNLPDNTSSGILNIGGVLFGKNLYQTRSMSAAPTATGSIGIGVAVPTARLQMAGGTATAGTASFKINSGTLLTTTEAGAIENDGTHLYFTAANSGTRFQLDQQSGSATFQQTLTAGSTLTTDNTVTNTGHTLNINTGGILATSGGFYNSAQGSSILNNGGTINNAVTSASGSVSNFSAYAFVAPTITSTNTGITYSSASTLYISNSPTFGTNSTGTGMSYALNVAAGISHFGVGGSNASAVFDGGLAVDGSTYTNTIGFRVGASTTTKASMGWTTGVDVTSPSTGMMWYNGTNLFFRDAGVNRDLLSGITNYRHTIFTPTTGGTVSTVANQYNIVNPAGALATLTVNLPSSPADGDVVYVKYTQTVSAVTYGNGTVVDGITAPVAGGLVVLTYDSATTSWY